MLEMLMAVMGGDSGPGTFRSAAANVNGTTYAGLRLNADGSMDQRTAVSTYSQKGDWCSPAGITNARTYSVYFDSVGVATASDPQGEWVQIGNGTAREWWHNSSGLTRAYTIYLSYDSARSGTTIGSFDQSFTGNLDVP